MILELCKGVHCVDLGESFQTHIYLQNLASIQPRTSPLKFARSSRIGAVSVMVIPIGAEDRRAPRGKHRSTAAGSGKHRSTERCGTARDRAHVTGLLLGYIEADFCNQTCV